MAGGGWSSLPADLLKEVSARLSSDADLLHIHQVCHHWRAFTSLPAAFRPWVVTGRSGRTGLEPIGEYSLRLPRRDAQRLEVRAPPAGLTYCCGTSRGWLALVDDDQSPTRLVLWEPLSGTEISLPCLSPLTRIFISDDPLTSSDWIAIAAQIKGEIGQKTLFWRPGDAAWTLMNERGTCEIDTIAFLQGKAYYIDIQRNIIICDLSTGSSDPSPKVTPIFFACFVVNKLCRCHRLHAVRGAHLAVCNGELLLVVLYWGSHPCPAEVYKPIWTPNQRLELHERVRDLGGHSLFVGRGDTFALSATEFPVIKRNCIYYADIPCNKPYWISVFHLETDVVEEIPYPEELNCMPYGWFCPRKPFLKQP
ncbi:hypothetical protein BAE44_0022777 [Dichanthelium oligosanthes]|uniref:Uncharacterized protein n=1 Tax=Dichanthelium oligosanthes TaxID=888268 RepID=A0A1E5UTS7_9POAL|nr:hypothetical protein BAE44_0022777 [Dichanthelium oligosanthes]